MSAAAKLSRRYQPQPAAGWCPDCGFTATPAHGDVEDLAAGHAATTGHRARVTRTQVVIFTPPGARHGRPSARRPWWLRLRSVLQEVTRGVG